MFEEHKIELEAITLFFNQQENKVFRLGDISLILKEQGKTWDIPSDLSAKGFIKLLIEQALLKKVELKSPHYETKEIRYLWGEPTPYAIGLSLRHKSYLTHASALFLHGLTDQIPKTVYVNYEQSQKPKPQGSLSQEGLDRAFANKQRESKLWFDFEDYRLLILSGKATGRLEVTTIKTESGEALDVTRLERTLIDIVVRPSYGGGVFQVLEAYRQAKDLISINTLTATLKKLDYIYPYHQAIGFYMERAGYKSAQLEKVLRLGLKFDFYLAHGLPKNKLYDDKWRIFYPQGF